MLKDMAHIYKEKYAKHHYDNLSFTHSALINFFKYIAPSLFLFLVVTITLYSLDVCAEPQGFSEQSVERAAPKGFGIETNARNTVKGVLQKGRDQDYVLLEGLFVQSLDESMQRFTFADAAGDTIEVHLEREANPLSTQPYYIWGRIQSPLLGSKTINVIDYTLVH